jgi:hypothetical protein
MAKSCSDRSEREVVLLSLAYVVSVWDCWGIWGRSSICSAATATATLRRSLEMSYVVSNGGLSSKATTVSFLNSRVAKKRSHCIRFVLRHVGQWEANILMPCNHYVSVSHSANVHDKSRKRKVSVILC